MNTVEFESLKNLKSSLTFKTYQDFHSSKPLLLNLFAVTPLKLALGLLVISFLLSFFIREFLILFLSLFSFLSLNFYSLRTIARYLSIKRVQEKKYYIQNKKETMRFIIRNLSAFTLFGFILEDNNELSKKPFFRIFFDSKILPGQQKSIHYFFKSDSQLGPQSLGPCSLILQDLFGIFQFRITEKEFTTRILYPESKSLEALFTPGSPHNYNYGSQQTLEKGHFVNFNGIREYRLGDPLNHVAWKLSGRHQKLLIKEFEKSVNSLISIYIDLNPYSHVASNEISTWSRSIEVALDLSTTFIAQQNSIQVITPYFEIPMAKGPQHLQTIISKLLLLNLRDFLNSEEESTATPIQKEITITNQLKKIHTKLPNGSQLIVILPTQNLDTDFLISILQSLPVSQTQIIFIQTSSYLSYLSPHSNWVETLQVNLQGQDPSQKLTAHSIPSINHPATESVREMILKIKERQKVAHVRR